ncbi:TIGR02117 family protein [Sphingobacterium pedocola]|uniref:TIGR02117 family protein n=1 Tax=Sphingobacterium pedocola TaxID=2082722 RepID=A0ABR9TBV5_9SPHI|nr:TIGR02117 family protein [Sphingobacterium pedocola]MBE8722781.1 TIGR02117 family protein [Sphingobacterium pedocola]
MKILLVLTYVVAGLLFVIFIYFGAEFILSRIPAVKKKVSTSKDVTIYLLSNDVHTDLVFPVQNDLMNWSSIFPFDKTRGKDTAQQWVSIGWGDKGFYLKTPEWKDLKVSTALIAVSGLGETALHVTYYKDMTESSLCYKIAIDSNQYKLLVNYVLASLDSDSENNAVYIETTAQYNQDDAFYEAKGAYNLLFSCNTWTNNALKRAGLPSGVWTVFDKGILRHYR